MAKGEKTGGRTLGTPNKATAIGRELQALSIDIVRQLLLHLLHAETEDGETLLISDIQRLIPRDRLKILIEILKLILPKPKEESEEARQINIEQMITQLINQK